MEYTPVEEIPHVSGFFSVYNLIDSDMDRCILFSLDS